MSNASPLLASIPADLGKTKPTAHARLMHWIEQCVEHGQPDQIFFCDGSEAEKKYLTAEAERLGVLQALNPAKLPGSYLSRSNPNDVARVEQFTFICTPTADEAGPTNNWTDPAEMRAKLLGMLKGAFKGRCMYVVPYMMGPAASPLTQVGVEITDSIYVVLNMRIMSRMGGAAYLRLGADGDFNKGLHCTLDLNPERRFICHFPQDNEIISVGSGYGGNALLGKKCLALRIGSYLARKQGWMAEHMLLLCAQAPDGRKHYIAAAFPSACGKTNFSMLIPPAHFAGWKITTIGDDIAWMKPGSDGRLYAINPEFGYFGVAPGTNYQTNPNAMRTIERDTIYTNVALTPEGDVWWEGKDGEPPENCTDWLGRPWTPASPDKAAHPNSRFTAPATNNPALALEFDDSAGVPISAIIFGGRRASTVPLVFQSRDWNHGTFVGATMGSEMTAAAAGTVGQLRLDPMAMLPFCGYHVGDYFAHWIEMGAKLTHPPLIFGVNWFRKDEDGKFLWPGFGENMRALKWIIDRCAGEVGGKETPIGTLPEQKDFDLAGLEGFSPADFEKCVAYDATGWRQDYAAAAEFFTSLGSHLPPLLKAELETQVAKVS